MYKLTGKTRYRHGQTGFFFKRDVLILQVEMMDKNPPSDSNGMPEHLPGAYWVDAQVEDLSELTGVAGLTQ